MSDDRKGPVWRKPRQDDRDTYRAKTPPHGVVSGEINDEPATGRVDITPDELARIRSRRPTPERLQKLEEKHDKLDEKVDAIHVAVSEMRGEMKATLSLLTDQGKTQRTRITTNGKVLIAIVGGLITTIGGVLVAVLA